MKLTLRSRGYFVIFNVGRSANQLVRQYGEDAAVHAAMKADKFLAKAGLMRRAAAQLLEIRCSGNP